MEELSLHVLDIAQNSILAHAARIVIRVEEDPENDRLTIDIEDDGAGMKEEEVRWALDPFSTSRPGKRVGLGLPLFGEAARSAGGGFEVRSRLGRGTTVRAWFVYSHPDRQPLGRMTDTLLALIASRPDVDLRYEHVRPDGEFILDTSDLKRELGDRPITDPEILSALRRALNAALE